MADIDFSQIFNLLFSLPDCDTPEEFSPVSDAASLLRTPEDELHDFNWSLNDIAIQDPISHLLDDMNSLIQQSSNEGSKPEEIHEKQEVLQTVAPYDTLLRHPSHPDYQSTAGAGPSSQGTTAPGTPPLCEVAPPPEPEVSQPPSKKRKGKERAVPCQESATEAAPLGTPSVDGGPQYVEGVHYTVVDHLQDGTKRPCKWSGSCSYALLMQQGVWTKHLRKNHEEDMKASQPDGRIPCKWTGCKRSYQSPSALAKHVVRNHFGKQWYCHLCRTHFSGDMSHVNRHCNKSASHLKVAKKLEDGHKPWIVERVWDEQQDADESGQGDKGEGPSQRNFKRRREEDES